MPKIIVIDDELALLGLIKELLADIKAEIKTYSDPAEAFKDLTNEDLEPADLIIMDVNMPKVDGYSLTMKFQDNRQTRKVPISVMSAEGRYERLFDNSPNVKSFFRKPFNCQVLVDRAKELLALADDEKSSP